jgi:cyanophycin synthetase
VGGKAVFVREGVIYAACGGVGRAIVRVEDVPVTLGGLAFHNVQNAVIAAAACYCMKVRYLTSAGACRVSTKIRGG